MIRKFKKWLCDRFLPMWAKETVLHDNRVLQREIECLRTEIARKDAYISGLESGVKAQRRIVINTSEVKK